MYIVMEGIIKAGKSKQLRRLIEYLRANYLQKKFILTREPGGTGIADDIREMVQGKQYAEELMDAYCDAYLYASSRAQSLRVVVKPWLAKGAIVISDRSFVTSLVYQGFVQGLGIDTVLEINHHAIAGTIPDAILFLDIDVDTALSRINDRDGDKWENKDATFFNQAREGYQTVSALPMFNGKWHTLDASGTEDEVFERILKVVLPLIENV